MRILGFMEKIILCIRACWLVLNSFIRRVVRFARLLKRHWKVILDMDWCYVGIHWYATLRFILMVGWRSSCFVGNSVGLFNGGLYCYDIGFVSSVNPFRHESCITLTGWPANSCLCVRSSGNGLNSACTPH